MSVHFRHGQWVEADPGEYGERIDLAQDPNALTASAPDPRETDGGEQTGTSAAKTTRKTAAK